MKKTLTLLAFALALGTTSHAQVAQYTFTGSQATSSDTDVTSTASAITNGAGFSGVLFDTTLGNPAPSLSISTTETDGTTQGGAVTANDYFTFTITPNVGTLTLGSIIFDYASSSTTATFPTETFFVRSSLDSFGANIGSSVQSNSGTFATAAYNLSAAFQAVTSPVEFRIYISDGTTNANRGALLDNITVNATAVPEPSTYVMLIGGVGAMALVYRRKAGMRA